MAQTKTTRPNQSQPLSLVHEYVYAEITAKQARARANKLKARLTALFKERNILQVVLDTWDDSTNGKIVRLSGHPKRLYIVGGL